MREQIKYIHLLLSLSFILSACGLANEQSIEPTKLTNTFFTATASISSTPKPTIALTKTPTLLPTSTLSLSWTPLPTLPANNADQQFLLWMHGTPDCQLPCWAGITPGVTTWEEAIHLLTPVIELHITKDELRCRFGECKNFTWQYQINNNLFSGGMYNKENIIYSIFIGGNQPSEELSLQEVFQKYGTPKNVLIIASPHGLSGDPPMFYLYALYPDHSFVIKQRWQAQVSDKNIKACGKPESVTLGIVAIDEDQWNDNEIYQTGHQLDISTTMSDKLRPIEDVTNMNVESFYNQILKNDPSFCIVTPVEYWP